MIKSRVILAVSFVALFACGVARADIASVKYVNDNKLSGGENVTIGTDGAINVATGTQDTLGVLKGGTNVSIGTDGKINVPTLDENWYYYGSDDGVKDYEGKPVSGDAFMRALRLVLPGNYINSDDWTFWNNDELESTWYNEGMSLSDIVRDLAYNRVKPLTKQVSDLSYQITSKQNEISTSYAKNCDEEEGEWVCDDEEPIENGFVVVKDGRVLGARLMDNDEGQFITGVSVNENDSTVTLSRGNINISGVEDRMNGDEYDPGFVITGLNGSLESVDLSVNGSPVSTSYDEVDWRMNITLPTATDEQQGLVKVDEELKDSPNPVQNSVVTAALDGKQDAFTDEDLAEYIDTDSYERGGVPVGYVYDEEFGTFEYQPLSLIKASLLPFPGKDAEDAYRQGAVYVADSSEEYSELTDEMDGVAANNRHNVVPSVEYMNSALVGKQDKLTLTAGAGIDIGVAANNEFTISAKDATAAKPGIAPLGTIPAGPDKSQKATIWIE